MDLRLLFIFAALYVVHGATFDGSTFRCPLNCICNQASDATCTSLNTTSFGLEIFTLTIIDDRELNLSSDVFKNMGLESLNNLYIRNSTITELDENAFNGLKLLVVISIQDSVVPEVPKKLFAPLERLVLVDMSNNTLNNFAGIHSTNLQELNLSGCQIRNIEYSCVDCPQLSYLKLANNLIEHVPANFGQGLEHLNLSHNLIKNINFVNNENNNLVTIDLSYNPIKTISGEEVEIEELYLKNSGIKNLDFLANFTSLFFADLSGNQLTALDKNVFDHLEDLKTLDLSSNQLRSIDGATFKNNDRLTKLILSKNYLDTLPEFVTNDEVLKLTYFACDDCGLSKLPGTVFKHAPSLITISLRSNPLSEIPATLFQYVPSLVKVDLTGNLLTRIDNETFKKNSGLKNVNLSKTQLKKLDPTVFSANKVLKYLDVSFCQLDKLWSSTKTKIPSLAALYAGFNNITTVSVDELEVTKKLETLDLEGNPFDCSRFTDMHKWIVKNNVLAYKVSERLSSDASILDSQSSWLSACYDTDYYTDEKDYDSDYQGNDDDDDDDDASNDLDDGHVTLTEMKQEETPDNYFDVKYNDEEEKEEKEFEDDVRKVMTIEESRFSKHKPRHEIVVFLLPTLVFVLTALIVLVVTVSAILCILYKRNRKPNSPQINIIPWSTAPRMKKHSGSVYRPLSEEKIPV